MRFDLSRQKSADKHHSQHLRIALHQRNHAAHYARAKQRLRHPADICVFKCQIQRHRSRDSLSARQRHDTRRKRSTNRHHAKRAGFPIQLIPPRNRQRRAVIKDAQSCSSDRCQRHNNHFINVAEACYGGRCKFRQKNRSRHRHPFSRFGPKPGAQPKQRTNRQLPAPRQFAKAVLGGKTQHHTHKSGRHAKALSQQYRKHRALTAVSAARKPCKRERRHHRRAKRALTPCTARTQRSFNSSQETVLYTSVVH